MLPVHVTVSAVIEHPEHSGLFLMVEEVSSQGRTVYNQPAGHLDANESLYEAVVREVHEETGIQFEPSALLGVYNLNPADNGQHYLRFCFRGKVLGKTEPNPHDTDIVAAHWMSLERIIELRDQHRSGLITQCFADYLQGKAYPLESLFGCGSSDRQSSVNNESEIQQQGIDVINELNQCADKTLD